MIALWAEGSELPAQTEPLHLLELKLSAFVGVSIDIIDRCIAVKLQIPEFIFIHLPCRRSEGESGSVRWVVPWGRTETTGETAPMPSF